MDGGKEMLDFHPMAIFMSHSPQGMLILFEVYNFKKSSIS